MLPTLHDHENELVTPNVQTRATSTRMKTEKDEQNGENKDGLLLRGFISLSDNYTKQSLLCSSVLITEWGYCVIDWFIT